MVHRCEACGAIVLVGKICKKCGHVNAGLIAKMKVADQQKLMEQMERQNLKFQSKTMRDYRSSAGKIKGGGGGVESSPLKFFGLMAGIALVMFLLLKPSAQGVSGWISGAIPNLPGFMGNQLIGLSVLDWIVILIISAGGAGMMSSMTLPAIGILVGISVVFILFIWPLLKPSATGLIDIIKDGIGMIIPGWNGGGGQTGTTGDLFDYRIEKVSDRSWDLKVTRKANGGSSLRITAELDNGQQLKSSETTFQVGQGEKTVIINSDNAITDDDYRVIVKLEYDYTSSAFINFFFLKGSAKDTTYTKPQGPVDVSIRVRPDSYAVEESSPQSKQVNYVIDLDKNWVDYNEDHDGVSAKAEIGNVKFSPDSKYYSGVSCDFDGNPSSTGEITLNKPLTEKMQFNCDVDYRVPDYNDNDFVDEKTVQSILEIDYRYMVLVSQEFSKGS